MGQCFKSQALNVHALSEDCPVRRSGNVYAQGAVWCTCCYNIVAEKVFTKVISVALSAKNVLSA